MRVSDLPRYATLALVYDLPPLLQRTCVSGGELDAFRCFYIEWRGIQPIHVYGVKGDTPYSHTPVIQLL